MVPAALLSRLGIDVAQRTPEPQVAITDHQPRCPQTPCSQVPQQRRPALGRRPIAALQRHQHFPTVAQPRNRHQQRRFAVLQPGCERRSNSAEGGGRKARHLPTARACYAELVAKATQEALGYEQFLLELLEREREGRCQRRIERLLHESRLPLEKSFETFDLKRLPPKLRQQVTLLRDGSFVERRENILAFGKPGSGKTHLLCALCQELVRQGTRVRYTTCSLLVQELLVAKRDLLLPQALKRLARYEALLIDDLAMSARIETRSKSCSRSWPNAMSGGVC